MIQSNMNAQLVKVCSMGLTRAHLGKTIQELQPHFQTLAPKFRFNVCGEGGEYETAVFDCPLFKTHRIVTTEEPEVVIHEDNPVSTVAYLRYNGLGLEEKTPEQIAADQAILQSMVDSSSTITAESLVYLDDLENQEQSAGVKDIQVDLPKCEQSYSKLVLSVSRIDPSLTEEQIKTLS